MDEACGPACPDPDEVMKRPPLLLLVFAATLGVLCPIPLFGGNQGYPSKVVGECSTCGGPIYAFYRPVRCSDGTVHYAWVPEPHRDCQGG